MIRVSRWQCLGNVYVQSSSCSTIMFCIGPEITISCRLGRHFGPKNSLVNPMFMGLRVFLTTETQTGFRYLWLKYSPICFPFIGFNFHFGKCINIYEFIPIVYKVRRRIVEVDIHRSGHSSKRTFIEADIHQSRQLLTVNKIVPRIDP